MRLLAPRLILLAALAATPACSSGWVDLSPLPPAGYVKLGPAEGRGCATYFLALPWHQFIEHGAKDRLVRARSEAIASVPGATGLVGVTLRESWSYWGLFSRRCATLRADAIR